MYVWSIQDIATVCKREHALKGTQTPEYIAVSWFHRAWGGDDIDHWISSKGTSFWLKDSGIASKLNSDKKYYDCFMIWFYVEFRMIW